VPVAAAEPAGRLGRAHAWAAASLLAYGVLLAALPVLAATVGSKPLAVFDSFYRGGALVFGGGHCRLPCSLGSSPPGWISDGRVSGRLWRRPGGPGAPYSPLPPTWARSSDREPARGRASPRALSRSSCPDGCLSAGRIRSGHLLRTKGWATARCGAANAAVRRDPARRAFTGRSAPRGSGDGGATSRPRRRGRSLLGRLRVPPWVIVALMAAAASGSSDEARPPQASLRESPVGPEENSRPSRGRSRPRGPER